MDEDYPRRTAHVIIEFDVITTIPRKQYKNLDHDMNITPRVRMALNATSFRKANMKITVEEVD